MEKIKILKFPRLVLDKEGFKAMMEEVESELGPIKEPQFYKALSFSVFSRRAAYIRSVAEKHGAELIYEEKVV